MISSSPAIMAPLSGAEQHDGVARILGSTVANPLTRMQFEYRATVGSRQFSASLHGVPALQVSAADFAPDNAAAAAWAFLAPGTGAAAPVAGFEPPTALAPMFAIAHEIWRA